MKKTRKKSLNIPKLSLVLVHYVATAFYCYLTLPWVWENVALATPWLWLASALLVAVYIAPFVSPVVMMLFGYYFLGFGVQECLLSLLPIGYYALMMLKYPHRFGITV